MGGAEGSSNQPVGSIVMGPGKNVRQRYGRKKKGNTGAKLKMNQTIIRVGESKPRGGGMSGKKGSTVS